MDATNKVNCSQCGAVFSAGANYCSKCGAALTAPVTSSNAPTPNDEQSQELNDAPPSTSLTPARKTSSAAVIGYAFLVIAVLYIISKGLSAADTSTSNSSATSPENSASSSSQSQPSKAQVERARRESAKATLTEFNALTTGMTYAEVVRIIGSEGTVMSSTHTDGIPGIMDPIDTVMYTWEGSGGFGANMNAMFQNDKLMSKAQLGLQ